MNIINRGCKVNIDTYIDIRDNKKYKMNDLCSVYTHYDPKSGKNVATENIIIKGDDNNGENI